MEVLIDDPVLRRAVATVARASRRGEVGRVEANRLAGYLLFRATGVDARVSRTTDWRYRSRLRALGIRELPGNRGAVSRSKARRGSKGTDRRA